MTMQNKREFLGQLPFWDSDGIMHAKQRPHEENVEHQTKHTIILHSQTLPMKALLEEMHRSWKHEVVEIVRR